MKVEIELEEFIKKYVTKRSRSLLEKDLVLNDEILKNKIDNKSVLVIGGAGTIGSSYIKALLKFQPRKLVVVDINENGLTELVRDLRSSFIFNIPNNFITYPVNFGDKVFVFPPKYGGRGPSQCNPRHRHVQPATTRHDD